jgi:hypothetical protein
MGIESYEAVNDRPRVFCSFVEDVDASNADGAVRRVAKTLVKQIPDGAGAVLIEVGFHDIGVVSGKAITV